MNLEKRVEVLEQEVEVLKNQIQRTLLEIKEQILTNTYPDLRADVPASSHETQVNPQPGAPNMNSVPSVPQMPPAPQTAETNGSIPVRQVSLENLGAQQISRPMASELESVSRHRDNEQDWATMAQLEEWVSSKINDIGPKRTEELIYIYAENGHFDEEVANTLFRLLEVYERSNHHHHQPPAHQLSAAPKTVPEHPRPKRAHGARPKREKRQQQRKTTHQTQTLPDSRNVAPRRPTVNESIVPGRTRTAREVSGPAEEGHHFTEEEVEDSSNLILRLIAGVQNAGANVRWTKKHG